MSLSGVAGALELILGALLLLGLFTRPVAFLLAGEMAFAYFIAHAPRSFYPLINGGTLAILFVAYPQIDWEKSHALTVATFAAHDVPLGTSVFCQEGQSGMALAPAMAAADELSALKAQLEALQRQVDDLASWPSYADLPEGASLLTLTRGSMLEDGFARMSTIHDHLPSDRGITIAVAPTADLPAPVHEVTISGYVKGDVIYDLDQDLGDFFAFTDLRPAKERTHIRLHARQSRFRIRSRSDTAIGQIRTWIEGDFFGAASVFLGGPPPGPPFGRCGIDPTGDSLGCAVFPPCR